MQTCFKVQNLLYLHKTKLRNIERLKFSSWRVQCLPGQGCWISALPLVTLRPIECNLPRIKSGFLFELLPPLSHPSHLLTSLQSLTFHPALRGTERWESCESWIQYNHTNKHSQGPWLLRPRRSVREVYTIKKQSPKYTEEQTPAIIINQAAQTHTVQVLLRGNIEPGAGYSVCGAQYKCVCINVIMAS